MPLEAVPALLLQDGAAEGKGCHAADHLAGVDEQEAEPEPKLVAEPQLDDCARDQADDPHGEEERAAERGRHRVSLEPQVHLCGDGAKDRTDREATALVGHGCRSRRHGARTAGPAEPSAQHGIRRSPRDVVMRQGQSGGFNPREERLPEPRL
eukprot:3585998-Prymnesium_polylepis.1